VRHEVARGKAAWILPREGRPGYTAGRPIPDSVKERIAASLYTPIYLIDAKSGQVVKVFGKIAAARAPRVWTDRPFCVCVCVCMWCFFLYFRVFCMLAFFVPLACFVQFLYTVRTVYKNCTKLLHTICFP